jgi:hypothetical protein
MPNPANAFTTINFTNDNKKNLTLNIYNSIGELVKQEKISDKQTSLSIDVRAFAGGTYFYQMSTESGHSKMMKMVVLK